MNSDWGDVKERIREANDIIDVVGSYVPLKRAGSGWKALCPFHDEKTPSFNVNQTRQWYTCFGCGERGDVYTFIQKMEGVEFPEALRMLADRASIEMPEKRAGDAEAAKRFRRGKDLVYRICDTATTFYERMLHSPRGETAREYLKGRGIGQELAGDFRLGYAPDGWDELAGHLASKKAPEKLMLAAGLVRQRESGGVYDLLRHRLIFPIADSQRRVVGFGGRFLPDESGADPEDSPKYVNSPEGPLFKKSKLLYGIDKAQAAMRDSGEALLVEGYTDVVACHKAGVKNAVAALGTALTRDHVKTLRRYATRAAMLFDPDEAGLRAARRAVAIAVTEGYEVRAATLESGADPAEVLEAGGVDILLGAVADAKTSLEFAIDCAVSGRDLSEVRERSAAVAEVMELVSAEPNRVTRTMMRQRVAERFGVPETSLGFEDPASVRRNAPAPAADGKLTRRQKAERNLVARLAMASQMAGEVEAALGSDFLTDDTSAEVYRAIAAGTGSPQEIVARLEGDAAKSLVIGAAEQGETGKRAPEEAVRAAMSAIEEMVLTGEMDSIEQGLRRAEDAGETGTDDYRELLSARVEKRGKIDELRRVLMGESARSDGSHAIQQAMGGGRP